MNAYQRIQKSQAEMDSYIMSRIRKDGVYRVNQAGYGVTTSRGLNSLKRLVNAGKIKYSKRAFGYVAA